MVGKGGEGTCGEGELNLGRRDENYGESQRKSAIGVDAQSMDEIGEEMMNEIEDSQKEDVEQMSEEDKDFEYKFLAEFEKLEHCNFAEIEERDKLLKLKIKLRSPIEY